MPDVCIQQVNSAIARYIWRGEILRVPLSTLQRRKWHGGWELINDEEKSLSLLFRRFQIQNKDVGTTTSEWLRKWDLSTAYTKPPHIHRVPATLGYMRQYAMDTAYISPQESSESIVAYKRLIYNTMSVLLNTNTEMPEMRIVRLWPNEDWPRIWMNSQEAPVSATDLV